MMNVSAVLRGSKGQLALNPIALPQGTSSLRISGDFGVLELSLVSPNEHEGLEITSKGIVPLAVFPRSSGTVRLLAANSQRLRSAIGEVKGETQHERR